MKKGIDIYNYEKKFEATVRNMRASKITEQNKKLIKKFYNFCFANGIVKPRVTKYIRTLRQLAEWTKRDFNVALKKFYKWLKGNNEYYPPEIKWLKTRENNDSN